MKDIPDTIESPESVREKSAERTAHYFQGEKLNRFSLSRQCALERAGWTRSETENYLLLLYLCVADDDYIDRFLDGEISTKDLRSAMFKWGDERGVTIHCRTAENGDKVYDNESTQAMADTAEEIWREARCSDFKTKEAAATSPDPNASGRGSRASTSRKSRPSSKAR